jgi:signal transduction histidine kinase
VPPTGVADEAKLSLATAPPTVRQRRLTFALAAAVLLAFGALAPFVHVALPRVNRFVPLVQGAITIMDLVTAALLFGQFALTRSRALLVLACGYLFSALTVVAHTLTFPGAFAPTGLLGAGEQSAPWIYLFWHFGFAASVLGYAVLKDRDAAVDAGRTTAPASVAWWCVAGVVAVASVLTLSVTAGHEFWPALIITETSFAPLSSALSAINFGVSALALALLWTRQRSVLDRWLMVALCAVLAEAGIVTFFAASRFTVSFYAGRLFALVVSTAVLSALLWETTTLYVRLAATVRALQRERANKLMNLEVVVASVAHEIKQPLTVIATRAGIVKRLLGRPEPDLDNARRNLDEMERASFGVSEVFESIRALFRNPAQEKQPLDLNELALAALQTLSGELNDRGIAIHTELAPELPQVLGHNGQLQEVLLNIIQNAIDAMDGVADRPHTLRVTTGSYGHGHVTLSIEDSGVGIARDRLANLFDAFVTTKARGTGLGLGICRMIVDRHEGQLSASSEVDKGTRFEITLPIGAKTAASAAA